MRVNKDGAFPGSNSTSKSISLSFLKLPVKADPIYIFVVIFDELSGYYLK